MKTEGHVTTEKTAKKYKLRILLANLGVIIGILWAFGASASADARGATADYTMPGILIALSVD